jgi:hypothetical protein
LRIFDAEQLELVLSGTVEIDIEDWRENTEYKGGFYDGHVVVTWFWNTVYSMNNADRLKLLQVLIKTVLDLSLTRDLHKMRNRFFGKKVSE